MGMYLKNSIVFAYFELLEDVGLKVKLTGLILLNSLIFSVCSACFCIDFFIPHACSLGVHSTIVDANQTVIVKRLFLDPKYCRLM